MNLVSSRVGTGSVVLICAAVLGLVLVATDRGQAPRTARPPSTTGEQDGGPGLVQAAANTGAGPRVAEPTGEPASVEVSESTGAPYEETRRVDPSSVVSQIAAFSGISEEQAIALLDRHIVAWRERPFEPLVPWEDAYAGLEEHLIGTVLGDSTETRNAIFEAALLGSDVESFLEQWSKGSTTPEDRAEIEELVDDARECFDLYCAEASAAIAHAVSSGRFDCWPYITVNESRLHTTRTEGLRLATSGGVGGGWVVQLSIFDGDYPAFDQSHADWVAVQKRVRTAARLWRERQY